MSREMLIRGLNEDLAGELGAIIRYTYHAGQAKGPQSETLRRLFRDGAADELEHAAFLTDIIVSLGGEPTTTPSAFAKPDSLPAMLTVDLSIARANVDRYREHSVLAAQLDDVELEFELEEIAADVLSCAVQIQCALNQM